jgi:sodium-dependent dicarboxylate transporter 2/3/5
MSCQYLSLKGFRFAEVAVFIDFIVLALLWLTRGPLWSDWFPKNENCQSFATDTTVAMLMCFILFVFPSRWRLSPGTQTNLSNTLQSVPRLLDWKTVEKNLPWGIIVLMGGGFAMAEGCKVSGLSEEISKTFKSLGGLSAPAVAIVVSTVVALVTEVTANVATTTLFLPILSEVAVGASLNPLYLMIPATIAASFAFMLPVATPPNAMVFSSGHLKVFDMVR